MYRKLLKVLYTTRPFIFVFQVFIKCIANFETFEVTFDGLRLFKPARHLLYAGYISLSPDQGSYFQRLL